MFTKFFVLLSFLLMIGGVMFGAITPSCRKISNPNLPSEPALSMEKEDSIPLPPVWEEFFSPNGDYVFVLSSPDNWESIKSTGELFKVDAETRKLFWTRSLPHEYRPRFVLVGRKGQVLLLDEWINVKSRYAVMILNHENQLVAQHDFEAVRSVLGIHVAKVVEMARHGWWITSPPILDPSGETARVKTAGKVLVIRLNDGHLSVAE